LPEAIINGFIAPRNLEIYQSHKVRKNADGSFWEKSYLGVWEPSSWQDG